MGTIMFGQSHDQPGLLVEPKPEYALADSTDPAQVAHFRNLIWPVVEEANKVAPSFSKIFKELILVTGKDKPLPRAGKGTVMRKMGLKEYEKEIEALYVFSFGSYGRGTDRFFFFRYATVESTQATESIEPPKVWKVDVVKEWLLLQVKELNNGREIDASVDLFEHGFDR